MPRKRALRGDREIVDSAIEAGLDAITKNHPAFSMEYISQHIDKGRLKQGVTQVYDYIAQEEAKGKRISSEEKAKFVYENIANYVASGGAFDETAKEVVLKNSLEEKVKKGRVSRGEIEGEQYLDRVSIAFKDIYTLMKSGDYAARMPKLAAAVQTVYDAGFMEATLDVLRGYGLVDKGRYETMKGLVKKKKAEGARAAGEEIERYSLPQKAAAAVLAISGAAVLVLTKIGITGNVIGASYNSSLIGASAGILLLALSALILAKKKR